MRNNSGVPLAVSDRTIHRYQNPFAALASAMAIALLLCLGIVFPSQVLATEESPSEPVVSEPVEYIDGLFGDYLSGRFASTYRDTNSAAEYLNRAVAQDPDNIELVRQAFSMSLASGHYDSAAALANRLALVDDQHTSLLDLVLIADAVRQADYVHAEERMSIAKDEGIINLIIPLTRAWLAAEQGNVDQAMIELDVLNEIQSFEVFGDVHEAFILDYTGQNEKAVGAYLSVLIKLKGADLQVALAYGNLLERMGKGVAANLLYEEFLKQFPNNLLLANSAARAKSGDLPTRFIGSPAEGLAEAYFNTSRRLANHRSRSPATIYLRLTLMLRPDFPVAHLLLANLMERDQLWESALAEYEALIDDPNFGWHARYEKTVLLVRLERDDEAMADLKAMYAEKPENLGVLAALADRMRDAKQYEEARKHYDEVINLIGMPKTQHWSLFYSRGVVQERLGNWKRAEKDLRTALALQPDEPVVLNYLGYSWLEQGKNLNEALEMIEKAVEKRPDDGYVIDSLGWALYQLKQYEESVGWLEKAIMLQPEDPTINDHLGDAYWRHGRRLEARFQWQHALVMKPEADDVPRIRDKLKNGLPEKHTSGR